MKAVNVKTILKLLFSDAIDRIQGGHLRGKIIINIAGDEALEGSTGKALYYNRQT
jgi:hypothetical protein